MDPQTFDDAFAEATGGETVNEAEQATEKEEAKQPEAEQAEKQPEAEQQAASKFDPWAGLNDEQRAYWESQSREKADLEHRWKSDTGRVAALQRKINELQAKPVEAPTARDIAEASESEEKWAEFERDWPEWAGPLGAKFKAERQAIKDEVKAEIQQALSPFQKQNEIAALHKQHPDAQSIWESQEFARWIEAQPAEMLERARSDYAADVGEVMSLFKADNKMTKLKADKSFVDWLSTKPESVRKLADSRAVDQVSLVLDLFDSERQAASTVADIKNRRAAQLEAAESFTSSPGTVRPVDASDFESAFQLAASRHTRK